MIAVIGGAGYIGSSLCHCLAREGRDAVIVDNLSSGFDVLARNTGLALHQCDIRDRDAVFRLLNDLKPDVVMHFAASQGVPESVSDPALFYRNNVAATINVLDAMREAGTRHFIFSSTAASYGVPQFVPITEDHPLSPTTPYGWSKIMIERILADYSAAYDLNHVALRYFNAAGDIPGAPVGELHDPETHLIPNILLSILRGDGRVFQLYGDEYPTSDGTCIRDYIHVEDLADAHIRAADYLLDGGSSAVFNLGTGSGNSVLEVLEACKHVTGQDIPYEIKPPRPGDPPILVASYDAAREALGWSPKWTSIEKIVESAWQWHSKVRHDPDAVESLAPAPA